MPPPQQPQAQQGYGRPPMNQGYNHQNPHGYHQTPPPQQSFSPPPPQGYGQPQRPGSSRPPPTPAPPQGVDPTLFPLFKAVDKDGSGQLSEKELRAALVNGDWTSFDPHTVRMMIRYLAPMWNEITITWLTWPGRMFDTDRSGTIGFNEFWFVTPS